MFVKLSSTPYLIGACCYFLLAVRLLFSAKDKQTNTANRYLAILFTLFAWQEADEFIANSAMGLVLPEFHNYCLILSQLLLGPLTYMYILHMVGKQTLVENIKHTLPFITMSVLALIVFQVYPLGQAEQLLTPVYIMLYLATLLAYVFMSLGELKQYIGGSKALFSNLRHHNLNWARLWIVFMLLIACYVFLTAAYQWFTHNPPPDIGFHYVVSSMAVVLLLWPDAAQQTALQSTSKQQLSERNTVNNIDFKNIFNDIETVLTEQKLYLKNGLSLDDLADAVGLTNHDVSAAINQYSGTCFYDYINRFRINRAKHLLLQCKSKPILDIAMDSGFNSKSAFYNAFKKQVMETPSEYRLNN